MTPARFAKLRAALARRQPDLTLVVEDPRKAHNAAALIRSADAAGVLEMHAVLPDGPLRRGHRVAGGAKRFVRVRSHAAVAPLLNDLKHNNFQIIAATFSDKSNDYRALDYTRPTALVLGSELRGVSSAAALAADAHAVIPMRGVGASLNVSVAGALLLYEASRQREAAGLYARNRLEPGYFRRLLFEWTWPAIAARCREAGIDYPPLDADGYMLENPFAGDERAQETSSQGSP